MHKRVKTNYKTKQILSNFKARFPNIRQQLRAQMKNQNQNVYSQIYSIYRQGLAVELGRVPYDGRSNITMKPKDTSQGLGAFLLNCTIISV